RREGPGGIPVGFSLFRTDYSAVAMLRLCLRRAASPATPAPISPRTKVAGSGVRWTGGGLSTGGTITGGGVMTMGGSGDTPVGGLLTGGNGKSGMMARAV